MRDNRTPSIRNKVTVANRQRLLFAGFCLAIGLLAGGVIFLLINFGNSKEAHAALGSNMGFENNLTEWTNVSGSWNNNSTSTYVRTGSKSAKAAYSSGSDIEMKNTNATIVTPATGTNYITVVAYAKSNSTNGRLRIGIVNTVTGVKTLATGGYVALTTTGWTKVSAVLAVSNLSTYAPMAQARAQAGSADVYVDDVHMYSTTSAIEDATNPTAATSITASSVGSIITLNWINGTDIGTGLDGVTILRYTGANGNNQALNDQATYHVTNSNIGPISVNSWNVIYQGTTISTLVDNPGSTGIYTYLIYMRDKAFNYTVSTITTRALVMTGSTTSLGSNISLDGLYLASGTTLTVNLGSTVTFRANATTNVYGTLVDIGTVANNLGGTVNMQSGSVYKYNKTSSYSPIVTANWLSGSTLLMCGAFLSNNIPGMSQSFYNVTWNCPGQAQFQDIPTGFTVQGDMTFTDSGPGNSDRVIWFNGTIKIKGNLYCSGLADVRFRAGSNIIFNGTSLQTINIASGFSPTWHAITIDNPTTVKILHAITVDSMFCLKSGMLDMNTYNVSLKNGCTVVRALGTYTNGNFTPVNSSDKYNLEYTRGGFSTGNELTSLTTYINNLIINTPSENIILNKTANVNGSLILTGGKIITGTYEVYVRNTAIIGVVQNSTTSYVNGNLRRNLTNPSSLTYLFPIGSLLNAESATLSLNNMMGVSNIVGSFGTSLTGAVPLVWVNGSKVNTLLNCGLWTMTPNSQPTSGTYDITVNGKGYTNPAANAINYAVIKRVDSSNPWKSLGTHNNNTQTVSGSTVTAKRSGLTTFSDFGIAYGQNVLPITLNAFNAVIQENSRVSIIWSTSAEINNAFFTLERSVNGIDFEAITEQEGQGTSTVPHAYAYVDEHPVSGVNYYRLKQTDFDGTFTYGPIRQVDLLTSATNPSSQVDITVYPNPSSGVFTLTNVITVGTQQHASLMVYNVKGQLVMKQFLNENSEAQLDLTSQPIGIYTMQVTDANGHTTTKQLLIQR